MILLYLAIAYALGILAGRWAWELGWWGCHVPAGAWLLPVVLLPGAIWLHRARPRNPQAERLRWPVWAGFEAPRTGLSAGVWLAVVLCFAAGGLRYASMPLSPCMTPADLGYWALPAEQAFDRRAPQWTIEGTIASYPLAADRRQRMVIAAHRLFMADDGLDTMSVRETAIDDPVAGNDDAAGRPVRGLLRLSTDLRQTYAYGQPVRLTGRLVQPPEFSDFSYRDYLAARGIHSVVYDARLETRSSAEWDVATEAGPGDDVTSRLRVWLDGLRSALYRLRYRSEQMINRSLPEPQASLANGMLLGIESGIPEDVYEQFNRTGTSHVIVISGANVAVVIAIIMAVCRAVLDRRRATWVAVGGVFAYTILVGGDASVTRAAIMGCLGAVALSLNRRSAALIALAAAGWLMALFHPAVLWDVSFQLSAAATAGLLLFTPVFNGWLLRWIPGFQPGPLLAVYATDEQTASGAGANVPGAREVVQEKVVGLLRGLLQDGLIVTVAANLTVTPLILLHFGRLSLTTLPANLAIAPVQPYIMIWGSAALIAGWLGATALVPYLLWVPWLCLEWTWAVVRRFAVWEGEGILLENFGLVHALLLYAGLGLILARRGVMSRVRVWWARLRSGAVSEPGTQKRAQWRVLQGLAPTAPAPLAVLAVATLLVWRVALTQPDGYLHVYFLDVGQGDGIFIQTPQGRQVLIDGGISPQRLQMELGAVMPFWDRTLDLLVLTHPDSDHMDGQIAVPARYWVDYALDTVASQANPNGERWRAATTAGNVEVVLQHAGGWIDLGDGVALWVIWPPEGGYIGPDGSNENSLVLKLVYGDFSVLLTGDAGLPSEFDLLRGIDGRAPVPLQSTLLKVGHHGSRNSTSLDFVRAVQPWLAVIQVGENRYGHPHAEVLENLAGHTVLRNDRHGRVHVRTDGAQMWVTTER